MHNAAAVGFVESIGDLRAVLQDLIGRQRPLAQPGAESLAFEIFEDQIVCSVLLPDVMQHANVRMRELRDSAGFPLEAFPQFRILRKMIGENLDGNIAVQARIVRTIDFPHAARAERGNDLIRPEFVSRS